MMDVSEVWDSIKDNSYLPGLGRHQTFHFEYEGKVVGDKKGVRGIG